MDQLKRNLTTKRKFDSLVESFVTSNT